MKISKIGLKKEMETEIKEMGLKVMQIGCDPKADSTILLRHGEAVPAVVSSRHWKS